MFGFDWDLDSPRKLSGNNLVAYKATLKLTQKQKRILIGSLLGDGFIDFSRTTKQPTYGFCLAQTWSQNMLNTYIKYSNLL